MSGPLCRIKVLDLSRVLAGPWGAQMLADLGADVIKVERPGEGDDTRAWGPPFLQGRARRGHARGRVFLRGNRGKQSVAVDFSSRKASSSCARSPKRRRADREFQGRRPRALRARLRRS